VERAIGVTSGAPAADRFAIARALREIGQRLSLTDASGHRARAYERAARIVLNLEEDLAALVDQGRLTTLQGIGPGLSKVITELQRTGRSALLDGLRDSMPAGALELSAVPGLSPARIDALHKALGIETVEALRDAARAGRLRGVPGFGPKTEEKILAAAERERARPVGLLLHEALPLAERLAAHLRALPGVGAAEFAGSLRRGAETTAEIDLVAASDDPEAAVAHLLRFPLVAAVASRDPGGCEVLLPDGLPVRLRVSPPAKWAALLHRQTGSPAHLARLQQLGARSRHTRASPGAAGGAASERDIYRALGLPWIPPELREDAGEVEAALAGSLPEDLVELADVKGMVHCHTVYSDGGDSIEDMARAAEAMGAQYLTITDHSQSARYARGLSLDRLRAQWDEIARLQERVAIRLLRGTECDILEDGSLDYPDAVLEKLDVIIASVHARHRMDEAQMTRRILRAMAHPAFKIWGHARGRLIHSRPPFACRMEEILDGIAASRAAVEINGDPRRLDLDPPWIRAARERGIRLVISTDAHSVGGLGYVRSGVLTARRGWATRRDVLNALGPDDFRAAVRP
jgi:DNA polymerase (family X)